MTKHHNPTPSKTIQYYKFNSQFRQQGESILTFMSQMSVGHTFLCCRLVEGIVAKDNEHMCLAPSLM